MYPKECIVYVTRLRAFGITQNEKFDGITEIDETYVGGEGKNKHKNKKFLNSKGHTMHLKASMLTYKALTK